MIATKAGTVNAISGTATLGSVHSIGAAVNVPVAATAMPPATIASASGGTFGLPMARPIRNATTVMPATTASVTVALTMRVMYSRILPANMPITIGSGSHAMMRAPTPARPSTMISTPAMRLAPIISAMVYLPASVPR